MVFEKIDQLNQLHTTSSQGSKTTLKKKKYTACAFIDIKAAFDSAWHPAILQALIKKRCPNYLVKIIKSFLEGRRCRITIDGQTMEFQIEIGCPQGSVLSAFLWIVLIDEIFYLSFPFSVFIIAYADDLTVGVSDADPAAATRKLEKACKLIVNWLSSIKLDVNAPKTAFLLFDWIKSNPTLSLSINLLDVVIPASVSTVYLGLTIDCHLSWNQHITSKCSSLGRLLFSLKQCLALTWGLNRQRLQSLYHLIAEPTILYACSVWAAAGLGWSVLQLFLNF